LVLFTYQNQRNQFKEQLHHQSAAAAAQINVDNMARFYKFVIQLEYNEEPLTLEELQNDFDEAVKIEDYKAAAKIKKQIDEHLKSDNENDLIIELEDYCYIDLDEVATFYKSEWENGDEFTKVILKSGFELPLSISFEEFTNLFFNINTRENA
jgi:hypothetical protein